MINGTTINEVGDDLYIKLIEPYKCLVKIDGFTDNLSGENTSNYFCKYFRWSTDNKNFSEFIELTDINLQSLTLDPNKDFWIEYKYEACELDTGHEMTFNTISLLGETEEGILEQVVQTVCCNDAWSGQGMPNLQVCKDCAEDNIFKPYNLGQANNMYMQMANIVNDIFGHCVKYYKVDPVTESKDTILNEHSLRKTSDVDEIKIMVPDNEFPTEEVQYDEFGMVVEGFEIHVMFNEFHKAFGAKTRPKQRDFLYIPKIDKMFRVNSVSLADEFNNEYTYWRVKLEQFAFSSSVDWDESLESEKEELEDFVLTADIFTEENKEEFTKITKPNEYKTILTGDNDYIRKSINRDLQIIDEDLNNNWTIVSKNYYDLSSVEKNEVAVKYRLNTSLVKDNNLVYTFWFKIKPSINPVFLKTKLITNIDNNNGLTQITISQPHRYKENQYVKISNTGVFDGLKQIKTIISDTVFVIYDNYQPGYSLLNSKVNLKEDYIILYGHNEDSPTASGISIKVLDDILMVEINNDIYKYDLDDTFNENYWYAGIISLNNTYKQLGFYLYELIEPSELVPAPVEHTELREFFNHVETISSNIEFNTDDNYMLLGNSLHLTNLRIFNTIISEEEFNKVLNQYVVRDTQNALLIDNAQEPLRLIRTSKPR